MQRKYQILVLLGLTSYALYTSRYLSLMPQVAKMPKTHLVFLKNHKCASTTVERIFLRYGKKHGLTFAFPIRGNRIGIPQRFHTELLGQKSRTNNNKFDFYVLHSRMNASEIRKIVYPDSKWVTIVREPTAQFESMWFFYSLEKDFKMNINNYLSLSYDKIFKKRKHGIWGIHQMMFDLGYDNYPELDRKQIMNNVNKLHDTFHLIMISERMDESLILLKDLMNWKFEDIAYISVNFRKNSEKLNLNRPQKNKLLHMSLPDVLLYNKSVEVLNKRIEEFGISRMETELLELKKASKTLYDECIDGVALARYIKGNQQENIKVGSYKIKNNSEVCYDLIRFQPDFIKELRLIQEEWTSMNWTTQLNFTNVRA